MKPNAVNLYFLIDSSNYMLVKQAVFADKFVGILAEYQQQKHLDVTVSLAFFSDDYKPVFWEKPLHEVEIITFEPSGQSALLESACNMIDEVGTQLAEKPKQERPEKVVFIILTVGQDSISNLKFTKQLLEEKIQHQQTVYSWQFLYPDIGISHFHSTVVRISEPIKKTTFQFTADILVPDNKTSQTVFEKIIDYVYEWINLKLGASTPNRKQFSDGIEFDKFILPSLRCAAISGEGQWCCRLVHADETNERRSAVPGLTWTSDIALHCNKDKIHFAMCVFAIATNNVEQIICIRPRLIADIAKQFQIVETLPIYQKQWKEIGNSDDIEQLYNAVIAENRHLPIVLIIKEPHENLFPVLLETQLNINRQSILAFAHIVALPENWHDAWTQKIGSNLTVPLNGIRIYYPHVISDGDSAVRHPSYSLEEISTQQWDNLCGMIAFAIYLKDCLSEYAAMKPMDWGSCLFYPKMRERLLELRREQLAKSQFESNYIVLLEEDSKTQKQMLEEQKWEIEQLKEERFNLTQKLQYQYRPQIQEIFDEKPRIKIRLDAKKELDKIDGKSCDNLHNIIKKCNDKQWRNKHTDWKWNKNDKTDLTVIKPGATAERVVGFEKDEIFFITHVFESHDEYINSLPYCWIEEFCNDEYVDV
ncbi:MAG: VWA domain-containing protein [Planctomycetaceae bacterium]|jgi:hypothetical protein|nr:VWA domain-containing protein [Planctomycetaceae bacterium]